MYSNSYSNTAFEIQLKNYIQTQLNQGYNIEVIKGVLIRQGYSPSIVNKVANDLSNVNINVKHEVHISKGTVIGVVAVIFIVGLIVFGILNISMFKPKDSLMDITITNTAYSYLPGETINFQVYVTNMGSEERFDYVVKYLVVDDAGKVITRKEDTLAVQTTASVTRSIQLPQNILPGKYYLQAISDYGNKQAKSVSEFEIVEDVSEKKPPTYVPPTSTQNTDTANTPSTQTGQNTRPNVVTSPSNVRETGKTFGDIIAETRQSAISSPEYAANNCAKLTDIEQKDICYSTVADSSQMHTYCDKISGVDYRDNCYLAFVMKGSVDVCNKITDNNSKSLCEQLNIIQLMDKYYKEGNTEKMMELNKQFNPDILQDSKPEIKTYEYKYIEPVSIVDVINTDMLETPILEENSTE